MNSFSIALKLFRTNVKTYGYYLAVMIFAVATFYDFMFLKHNARVLQATDTIQLAKTVAEMTSFILIVFLIFFMWFSSSFFLKQRKKEIGIYLLAGIENRRIALVFAIESFLLGLVATVCGLALGILLSKLFMMALARVILLKVTVTFSIPIKGVVETALTFAAIFAVLSLGSDISVARSKLIDLISGAKKEEGEPKQKLIKGILSVVLIGTGYYLSTSIDNLDYGLIIVVIVVWGTFWLFGSLLSGVLRSLLRRKNIMYKGPRIVSISNIAFRLKGNYRGLAMICALAATSITAFGTSLSLKYYVESTHDISFPYSFSWVTRDESLTEKAEAEIRASRHGVILKETIEYLGVKSAQYKHNYSVGDLCVLSQSEFSRIQRDLGTSGAEDLLRRIKPEAGQVIYIPGPSVVGIAMDMTGITVALDGVEVVIKDVVKAPVFGEGALMFKPVLIAADSDYDALKKNYETLRFTGFIVEDAEDSLELAQKLNGLMTKEAGFMAYSARYHTKLSTMGLFYFLGTFMSVVFILAIGSIMYFKLLSEALADKGKYDILGKLGMSESEMRKAVNLQVGMSLVLPLAVGIIHSIFAIGMLEKLLNYSLVVPAIEAVAVFVAIYGIFYKVTTNKFLRLVIKPDNA
jgi:putative ABC transport system permease protein